MRNTLLLGAFIGIGIIGCSSGGGVQVRTSVDPNADLAALHTFYVLTAPERNANAPLSSTDPMLDNSITNKALRGDLAQALQARGYAPAPQQAADFNVAYYAGTSQKLDTTYWSPRIDPAWRYSYRGRRGWAWPYYGAAYYGPMNPWGYGTGGASVTSTTEGKVIVDITDPKTNELLWRGQGVEPVSSDPATYASELQGVVSAILARFPQASQAVASNP
jgi:hypothetical protein